MGKRKSTAQFIEEARAIHGNRYGYELAEYVGLNKELTIVCPVHGPVPAIPYNHINKRCGCRLCKGKKIADRQRGTTEIFVKEAISLFGDEFTYDKAIYVAAKEKITITCKHGHDFETTPDGFKKRGKCTVCSGLARGYSLKRKSNEQFIRECVQAHGDKYDLSMVDYRGSKVYVTITCRLHGQWQVEPNAFTKLKSGCPECWRERSGKSMMKSMDDILDECFGVHGAGRFDYSHVEYKGYESGVLIRCLKHDEWFSQNLQDHLLKKNGCLSCQREVRPAFKRTLTEFIEEANAVWDCHYDYSKATYTGARRKIEIRCIEHDYTFMQTPSKHLSGQTGCRKCQGSHGERSIFKFLESNDLDFEPQKSFDTCRNMLPLPFDFFVPSKNLLIEFDGEAHHFPVAIFGGEEAFKKTQIRDSIKTKWAADNGYHLIRIPYWDIDKIPEILSRELLA